MLRKVTHCAGRVSANTTPHQLRWGDREMGTAISCTKCSQVAGMHEIDLREIFECIHIKFTVYGRKQASTNVRTYVNTLPQCSPASVGLAQARPN